jgi:hypothetical protein
MEDNDDDDDDEVTAGDLLQEEEDVPLESEAEKDLADAINSINLSA